MARYVTLDALRWAKEALLDSAHRLFIDILILKRDGLMASSAIGITTSSTSDSAARLMQILNEDDDLASATHPYFNPFPGEWLRDGYPRFGTYSSLARSRTYGPGLVVSKASDTLHNDEGGAKARGLHIQATADFAEQVQEALRRQKSKPLAVPASALALWLARYDELPEDVTLDDLVARMSAELNLTTEELALWFRPLSPPSELVAFGSAPLDRMALIDLLGAPGPSISETPGGAAPTSIEEVPEDLIDYIRGDLVVSRTLVRQIVTLIRAGKHIILTGPPGTGKSTLAANLAAASQNFAAEFGLPACAGAVMTTATADWSTFDTLGGYMPDPTSSGSLAFQEGIFLDSLRTNHWLIIDELNRADVDKAFGQFFTVLSGHAVTTGFKKDGTNIRIVPDAGRSASAYTAANETYVVGRDWRVIATMNTSDRNLLFQISSAFLRRFAVVHVGVPPVDQLVSWMDQRALPPADRQAVLSMVRLLATVRPLGPAIWRDLADYLESRTEQPLEDETDHSALVEALISFIVPQLDGLDRETLDKVEFGLKDLLALEGDRQLLEQTFEELFHG